MMFKRIKNISISGKLWLLAGSVLILLVGFEAYLFQGDRDQLAAAFQENSLAIAEKLSNELAAPMWLHQHSYVEQHLATQVRRPDISYLYLSDPRRQQVYQHGPSHLSEAVSRFSFSDIIYEESSNYHFAQVPVQYSGQQLGKLSIAFSGAPLQSTTQNALMRRLIGFSVFFLLVLILTMLVSSSIRRPFLAAADQLETCLSSPAGDLNPKLPEDGFTDYRRIAAAVNSITQDLQTRLASSDGDRGFLKTFFFENPIAIIATDMAGKILEANAAAGALFNRTPESLHQSKLSSFIGSSDLFNIKTHLFKTSGRLEGYVTFFVDEQNRRRVIEMNIVHLDAIGTSANRMLITLFDVTDRIETQQEILQSQSQASTANQALQLRTSDLNKAVDRNERFARKMSQLIKSYYKIARCNANEEVIALLVSEGRLLIEAQHAIIYLHENRRDLLHPVRASQGIDPRQLRSLPSEDSVLWTAYRDNEAYFQSSLSKAERMFFGLPGEDGYCMAAVPIGDHDHKYGVAIYIQKTARKFTVEELHLVTTLAHQGALILKKISLMHAFKEKASHLEEANEGLRQSQHQIFQLEKMESLGTLVGGIAHDFNNLLGIINPNIDLLRLNAGDERETLRRLVIIEKAASRATDLTRQLMMFSSTENTVLEPMSPNGLIRHLVTLLRSAFPNTIEIRIELEPDLPNILADIARLGQALMNLAMNGRDAMPDGGVLTFRTTVAPHAPVASKRNEVIDCVRISVIDTGTGIPRDNLYNIFDPFFTTKGTTSRASGLGLSVVYGIIKSHKGYVQVDSEPNHGTSVHIYFEPTNQPLAQLNGSTDLDGYPIGSENILIIDDESVIRESLRDLLHFLGYKVIVADSGKAALQLLTANGPIHAAIVDYAMPEMNGVETIKAMRRVNPELKVVLTTGYVDKEQLVREQVHVEGFLPKPYQLDRLAVTMQRVLN